MMWATYGLVTFEGSDAVSGIKIEVREFFDRRKLAYCELPLGSKRHRLCRAAGGNITVKDMLIFMFMYCS
jgi:hypothetical protein